jgi:hypothetical protein
MSGGAIHAVTRARVRSGRRPRVAVASRLATTPPAQALFQVAAVLIPALLLAGGLVRQSDEAETKWYGKAIAWLMVLVVLAAVGGELVAINGAFAVSSSEASIRIVVGVLAVGTIASGCALLVTGLTVSSRWLRPRYSFTSLGWRGGCRCGWDRDRDHRDGP